MASPTVIFIEPDPFLGVGTKVQQYAPSWDAQVTEDNLRAKENAARAFGADLNDIIKPARPLAGIAVKPNTSAYVQVLDKSGKVVKVFNKLGYVEEPVGDSTNAANITQTAMNTTGASPPVNTPRPADPTNEGSSVNSEPSSSAWTDWLLQSVQEQRAEKTQLVETFGESYLYVYGEKPRTLMFSGILMNTSDYAWRAEFWENWENYFRATKLVELGARMYIGWDDILVEGYPLSAVANDSADNPNSIIFNFTFFVTNYVNLTAQNKFLRQRKYARSAATYGYASSAAERDKYIVKDDRLRTVSWLGRGPVELGRLAEEKGAALIEQARLSGYGKAYAEELNMYLSRQAGFLADAAVKGGFKILELTGGKSPSNAQNYLKAVALRLAHDTARQAVYVAEKSAEYSANLRPGEFRAWFGTLGRVLSAVYPRQAWGEVGSSEETLLQLLSWGSVDRMVQAMAYAVVAPFGVSTPGAWKGGNANQGVITIVPPKPVLWSTSRAPAVPLV